MAKELAWKASKAEKAPWVRVPCPPPHQKEWACPILFDVSGVGRGENPRVVHEKASHRRSLKGPMPSAINR